MSEPDFFRFHGVGQGLFCSGILSDDFSFVYDCGSSSSKSSTLRAEISLFKEKLKYTKKKNIIDILVISHLHMDHWNGIPELLKDNGIKVKLVVMPYVSLWIQNIAMLESDEMSEDEYNFIRNPEAWLLDNGVENIIETRFETEQENSEDNKVSSENIYNIFKEDNLIIDDNERFFRKGHSRKSKIFYTNRTFKLSYKSSLYTFVFENLDLGIKADSYIRRIESICGEINIYDSLLSENELKNLKSLLEKDGCPTNSLNRTSLLMGLFFGAFKISSTGKYGGTRNTIPALLYTGDISLKENEKFDFLDNSDDYSFKMIQYPHHGAENDDNLKYFKSFNAISYVVSCGKQNRYNHPANGVVSALCPNLTIVNEDISYALTYDRYNFYLYKFNSIWKKWCILKAKSTKKDDELKKSLSEPYILPEFLSMQLLCECGEPYGIKRHDWSKVRSYMGILFIDNTISEDS